MLFENIHYVRQADDAGAQRKPGNSATWRSRATATLPTRSYQDSQRLSVRHERIPEVLREEILHVNEHQARLLLEAVAKGIKLTQWEEEQLAIFLATH